MNKKQELLDIIALDFSDDNKMYEALMALFQFISLKKDPNNLKNLSFLQIQNITKTDIKDTYKIILYFLGDRVNLLVTEFIFHDEITDEFYTLNDEDIELIKTDNVYYHPETDDPIDDFSSKILIQYSISPKGLELWD